MNPRDALPVRDEARDDRLELLAEEDGIAKIVERVPPPSGQSLESSSYRITLKLSPDKEVTALFSGDAMAELVRFIGYPRETTDRANYLQQHVEDLTAARDHAQERVDAFEHELVGVESAVRELVDNLADAWWLRAAAAYSNLSSWLARR